MEFIARVEELEQILLKKDCLLKKAQDSLDEMGIKIKEKGFNLYTPIKAKENPTTPN